jgi:transcriptional regulator with PAS, ATPase and Fis domain
MTANRAEPSSLAAESDLAPGTAATFGDLSSRSPNVKRVFAMLNRIAPTDLSLLIQGETGVGKEIVAESVHRESSRSDRPFIVFDCSEKSPAVAALELFGQALEEHFCGLHPMSGIIEQANGGTLVFDHIGALSLQLQARLLRAFERCQLLRVGGIAPISFDVRIIAVTSENLPHAMKRGAFRRDLYARVAQSIVTLPPLRRRLVDLPLLAETLLSQCTPPRSAGDIPDHLWSEFRQYRWPGNIRELKSALQRLWLQGVDGDDAIGSKGFRGRSPRIRLAATS